MFGTSSLTLSVPETAKYLVELQKNSIGLDEWFKRFDTAFETHTNYPPYNLVKESSVDFRLEIALAGYKREDIEVTTEWNKLFVEAKKSGDSSDEYLHQGLAKRAFTRTWTLSDDGKILSLVSIQGVQSASVEITESKLVLTITDDTDIIVITCVPYL